MRSQARRVSFAQNESNITPKSHECERVLDPCYTPSNAEKVFVDAKQGFMFSVFDKHLLTDIGKTDTFLSKTPIAPCYCQMMG